MKLARELWSTPRTRSRRPCRGAWTAGGCGTRAAARGGQARSCRTAPPTRPTSTSGSGGGGVLRRAWAPARFQVSPAASPADLDEALARRGYANDSPMSLRSAPARGCLDAMRPARRPGSTTGPADAWWSSVAGRARHGAGPETDRALLSRIDRPSAYASVVVDGEVASVGRAMADEAGRACSPWPPCRTPAAAARPHGCSARLRPGRHSAARRTSTSRSVGTTRRPCDSTTGRLHRGVRVPLSHRTATSP
jgi:hypothetical protein